MFRDDEIRLLCWTINKEKNIKFVSYLLITRLSYTIGLVPQAFPKKIYSNDHIEVAPKLDPLLDQIGIFGRF